MRSYFAYGSNIDLADMRARCPGARFDAPARLPAHCFAISRQGYATVLPHAGSAVYGVLWLLDESAERALDRYEGVAEGLYRKASVAVEPLAPARAPVEGVLIYAAVDPRPGRPRPSYLEGIVAAARRHGFPDPYVEELRTWLVA